MDQSLPDRNGKTGMEHIRAYKSKFLSSII